MTPSKSWTHRRGDTEAKREHDFNNWLTELAFAIEAGDTQMAQFILNALRESYKLANRKVSKRTFCDNGVGK